MAIDGVSLPFAEQIEYFRRKVNLPTRAWDDLRHHAHVRAFSVAGVTRDDMLADFRAAIDRAIAQGTGYEAFRAEFDAIVERTGWRFNARGRTEEQRRAWRARVIYRTNIRTSYMAGRFRQMSDPGVRRLRPWWRYRHNDSRHPRLHHLAWDGLVLPAGHVWFRVHWPPNGWGCNCDVESLSDRQLRRLGKTGADPVPDEAPYEARDPKTGQTETRWPGVDRGWEYNPGETFLGGVVPAELQGPLLPLGEPSTPANLPPLPPPRTADAARMMPAGLADEAYVRAFLEAFGATPDRPALWRDPSGGIVSVGRELFEQRDHAGNVVRLKIAKLGRERFVRIFAEAIRDPDEIWADWAVSAAGKPVLRRSYLARLTLPDGRVVFARFEWTSAGWTGLTAFDASDNYLERQRTGALLYRRG